MLNSTPVCIVNITYVIGCHPTGLSAVHSAILAAVDQRQTEERNLLLDLIQGAKNNNSAQKSAKKMNDQVLKSVCFVS